MRYIGLPALFIPLLAACTEKSDADYRAEITTSIHDAIGEDLAALVQGARELQASSPNHAWDPTTDAAAITAMQDAWKRTRVEYEHVEGAIVALFPEID